MSIAPNGQKIPKVRKDLNLYSGAPFVIKVLKDLENESARFSIDIKVLKDLKRRCVKKNGSRSGSSAAKRCGGQAPALRCVGVFLSRSGLGDPELQMFAMTPFA